MSTNLILIGLGKAMSIVAFLCGGQSEEVKGSRETEGGEKKEKERKEKKREECVRIPHSH
jgi:hypothetical protein